MIFAQLIVNSLIAGSLYALVAIGFSLIYTSNRFIHFTHGAVTAVGSYIFFFLLAATSQSYVVAIIGTLLFDGVLGFLMYRCLYYPLRRRGSSSVILLIASLGLMILLQNTLLIVFGSDLKVISIPTINNPITFGSVAFTSLHVIIVATAITVFVITWLVMKYTEWGRHVKAVADNAELAALSGIKTTAIQQSCFIVASMLAGLAGILIALEQNIEPFMGVNLIIKAFTGTIVGGILSVPGAILGSFLLGTVENFGIWYLPSGYKDAIAFILLLLFLLFRPNGILGIDRGIRE